MSSTPQSGDDTCNIAVRLSILDDGSNSTNELRAGCIERKHDRVLGKNAKPAITGETRLVNRKLNSASVTPLAAKVWPRAKTAQNLPESVRTRELARKGLPSFFHKARCKIVQYLYVRALRFSPVSFSCGLSIHGRSEVLDPSMYIYSSESI